MKPVFKEEMEFLKMTKEFKGYMWVDKRSFYLFTKEGEQIKLGRKKELIDKRLADININNIVTHQQYAKYHYINTTNKKINFSKIKQELSTIEYQDIIVNISGGKDSAVAYDIFKQLKIPFRTLFGNTSNETHHTYKYIFDNYPDVEIVNPDKGFYQYIKDTNFIPTRFARSCCTIYKEGNIGKYLDDNKKILNVVGIRRDESKNRSNYKKIRKGKGSKLQQSNWTQYNIIIDFTDLDIWSYILVKNLPINKLYKFGYNRVGCTNCPFRSDYELSLNKEFLPLYYARWQQILSKHFIDNGTALNLNCTLDEFLKGAWRAGVVREIPTQEVIDEFAKHRGITLELAQKYFKTNKCNCGKRLSKDVIALNMKLYGRDTNSRKCLKCLDKPKEELEKMIQDFKDMNCNLF